MSEDETPYGRRTLAEGLLYLERFRRVLRTYGNWIWSDGIEIARLKTRMDALEADVASLREYIRKLLTNTNN